MQVKYRSLMIPKCCLGTPFYSFLREWRRLEEVEKVRFEISAKNIHCHRPLAIMEKGRPWFELGNIVGSG